MRLEISELLVCPACGPPQPLVVLVDELEGRRAWRGRLGCPACDARYPIAGGTLHLGEPRVGAPPPGDPTTLALEVAALLDAGSARGALLLDESLAGVAAGVAGLARAAAVIALGAADPDPGEASAAGEGSAGSGAGTGGEAGATAPSRIVGVREDALPFGEGRLAGVALVGGSPARLREAARALAPGGRLVVLRPEEEARRLLEGLPLQLLAADARALVARRR